jgi:hypothetical protein
LTNGQRALEPDQANREKCAAETGIVDAAMYDAKGLLEES